MMRILVIRNDKLGDFMLAWPAFSLLKQQYPQAQITALVPAYTLPMAEICPSIDAQITDDRRDSVLSDAMHLSRKISAGRFDVSISLFSEMRTALAVSLARVPVRIGPATKLAQVFLNHRVKQRRSKSLKPEFEYNVDLARHYIALQGDEPAPVPMPPFLRFDPGELAGIRHAFQQQQHIASDCKLVFIHAGSGGSAINLSVQQFAELAGHIDKAVRCHFVLTAGPGELETAQALSELMADTSHSVYPSTQGLAAFSKFIAVSDLFISGSTGPLHIAGALNVRTAAFYPARRSATPLRWQTLNEAGRRMSFSPEKFTGENDMLTIDIPASANRIIELIGT